MELSRCKQEGPSSDSGEICTERKQRAEWSETKRQQNASMWREIDGLRHQTVGQLKVKYREVFGQESRSNHKQFLVRRIAWRLQANAEGDLSERARQRALALAEEAELRIRAPESFLRQLSGATGKRATRSPLAGARYLAHAPVPRTERGRGGVGEGLSLSGARLQIAERGGPAGDRHAVEWIRLFRPERQRGATS